MKEQWKSWDLSLMGRASPPEIKRKVTCRSSFWSNTLLHLRALSSHACYARQRTLKDIRLTYRAVGSSTGQRGIHPDRRQLGRLDCWLDWLWCRRHPNEFQCLGKYRYELAFCLIVSLNFYKSCSRPAETETGFRFHTLGMPLLYEVACK